MVRPPSICLQTSRVWSSLGLSTFAVHTILEDGPTVEDEDRNLGYSTPIGWSLVIALWYSFSRKAIAANTSAGITVASFIPPPCAENLGRAKEALWAKLLKVFNAEKLTRYLAPNNPHSFTSSGFTSPTLCLKTLCRYLSAFTSIHARSVLELFVNPLVQLAVSVL